jgi:large subunit ribosomal protein L25
MAQSELQVTARENVGKGAARSLRRQGLVPAVVYGKGFDPCNITVDPKMLKAALANEAGLNTLITLKGTGAFADQTVLLADSQVHNIRRDLEHVDFKTVDVKVETSVMVPVVTVGTPAGEKLGGTLNLIRHELEVLCLPTAIPKSIEIDITALNIGDVIHVDEITVPEGVTIPFDVNFTVITCMGRAAEEVEEVEGEEADEAAAVEPAADAEE